MSWEIVLGLAALFSFGVAVISPIIKLNTSITKLNASVDYLNKTLERHEDEIKDLQRRIEK